MHRAVLRSFSVFGSKELLPEGRWVPSSCWLCWQTHEHTLLLHQAVIEWLRTSTSGVLIQFTSLPRYYYFAETTLCRSYFAAGVRFLVLRVWGWWPPIPLCVSQGINSTEAEQLQSCSWVVTWFCVRQWLVVFIHALQHGAHAKTHKPCTRECTGGREQDW